jgi:oxygen-independent coproporphyrinogen-3 oxidase
MSLSLYIHFPFCSKLCGYCDYYKEKYSNDRLIGFLKAINTEINLAASEIDPEKRIFETIYIGGGTPSLMSARQLKDMITSLRKKFRFKNDLEFSIEINPENATGESLQSYKELGVNRPVFGVQSFNNRLLKVLKRSHRPHDSFRAVYLARAYGFDNFGIDMLFSMPRQTGKELSQDLLQLIELDPPHISYYQLVTEENKSFDQQIIQGKFHPPETELLTAMSRAVMAELKDRGYVPYDDSAFARSGFECRFNLLFQKGDDFLGLGPSAPSIIGQRRYINTTSLDEYISSLSHGKRPLVRDAEYTDLRLAGAVVPDRIVSGTAPLQTIRHKFGKCPKCETGRLQVAVDESKGN